jgi:transposase InsO family protein
MIDTFANCSVGWKASRSAKTDFVLDAREQALYARRPLHRSGLIHHSDRGGQYVSIRTTERLGKAGIEPSVGSVGDAYDNALAETINGLYKTEVIRRRSSSQNHGRGRDGNPQMGRLVQQPTPAGTHRKHPTR